MSPAMQGSANDACEEPLRPHRRDNCESHSCPPLQESDLGSRASMKGLRRLMLPVATGGDVCCVLKRSSDGWMQPPVRSPHKRAVVNILLPQFSDFISVVRQLTIECRLCSISAGCRCNGGGHAHVQGRTAQPGLRSGESSGFRSNAWGPRVSCRRITA